MYLPEACLDDHCHDEVRSRLARKITTTSAAARASMPGMPTSSAKPPLGKPVGVGVIPDPACSVNNAETVAVRGSAVTVGPAGVSVGGTTGVLVAVGVTGAGVSVIVGDVVMVGERVIVGDNVIDGVRVIVGVCVRVGDGEI